MAKTCDWFRDNSCDTACDGLDPNCERYSGDLSRDENTMSKKGNMAYWDSIEQLAEDYVKQLIAYSTKPLNFGNEDDTDDDQETAIMEMGKEVTEFTYKLLESRYGAEFPYVEGNY